MYYEFTVQIGATPKKVYLLDTTFNFTTVNSTIHKHHFSEVHVVLNGTAEIILADQKYELKAGDICIIPPYLLHTRHLTSENTKITVFMIDAPVDNIEIYSTSIDIIQDFFNAISESVPTQNYTIFASYISFLCSKFFKDEQTDIAECTDYSIIIEDYLNRNFTQNISLSDIAELLHFSEKQTSRMISKYTGNTLRDEIILRRIKAVNILKSTTDMTNAEIAEFLGYSTYSSLWKALKSQNL